jgi:hypothetical protein
MTKPTIVEIHEHSDRRVYDACMDRAGAASVSALFKVWYDSGQIAHFEGEIVPPKPEDAHDG